MAGLCLFACLGGCTVQQQQQAIDRTIGRAFGKGQAVSTAEPVRAAASRPATPAPASAGSGLGVSESEQIFLLWQKTMTAHPQIYLECLQDAECGPALKSYVVRLQHQAARTLELPPAYTGYDLAVDGKQP